MKMEKTAIRQERCIMHSEILQSRVTEAAAAAAGTLVGPLNDSKRFASFARTDYELYYF